jgi:hypothetical protein
MDLLELYGTVQGRTATVLLYIKQSHVMRDVNLSKFVHICFYEQVRFAQIVGDLLRQAEKIIRETEMFFKHQKQQF